MNSELHTERLLMRPLDERDLPVLVEMGADREVMAHFPARMNTEACRALLRRLADGHRRFGFGFWGLEPRQGGEILGFAGLWRPSFEAAFTPCVEIGWRLRRAAWGQGYATEAARRSLRHAFCDLALAEIVAFTVPANARSRAVMERLGMSRDPDEDFEHPSLPEGHALRRHVLYRLPRARWSEGDGSAR